MQWTGTLLRNVACFRLRSGLAIWCGLYIRHCRCHWIMAAWIVFLHFFIVPLCWYAVSERQMLLFFAGGLVGVNISFKGFLFVFQTSFCFFETSKLVSPQFFLFTLFCFREKNGEKTLQLTSINFVYMRLPDLQRIAGIAMASCTREAKFKEVQRHYINIYQSNFLLCYVKFIPL